MITTSQYLNSPVSSLPMQMQPFQSNQFYDPSLFSYSVQQLQPLLNYGLMVPTQASPTLLPSQPSPTPMTYSPQLQYSPSRTVSPIRSSPTYVDCYGNQLIPIVVSNPAPTQAPTISYSPQLHYSPSTSTTTQSVSSELFVPTEVCRSRRGSLSSCRSDSVAPPTGLSPPLVENKKELVPRKLNELQSTFQERFTTSGLRGKDIFRVKCKTKPSLQNIVELLQTLDNMVYLKEVSCPASTKKGKRQKRGFLCYVKVEVEHMPIVESIFNDFNEKKGHPFNDIEIDPQRKKPLNGQGILI
jgi:hypothetical protein